MKLTWVLLTALGAVAVQAVLARYTVGGRISFDVVLVGVVLAGLQWGAVAGILSGTVGGLLHDLIAGDVVGIGGLAKTLTGCAAGVVGTHFVLGKPQARTIIVAVATVAHRLTVLGLQGLIDQRWSGVSWRPIIVEMVLNALAGFAAFHAITTLPRVVARGRMSRRSSLRRRKW